MTSASRHTQFLNNATLLLLAQGSNYLVPLVTLPVLVARLQPDGFGVIAFAQAVAVYVQLLADYGFSISATRHIAANAFSEPSTLRAYVSTIHACKGMLAALISVLAIPVLYLWSNSGTAFLAGTLMLGMAIGNALTPLWYYQGTNNMKTVAIATGISKWAGAIVILLFVHSPADMLLAACAYAVPPLLIAAACTVRLHRRNLFTLGDVSVRGMMSELHTGAPYFVTSAGSGILANSSVLVLGLFHPPSVVGIYAAAEKVIKAATGCMAPISQSLYPLNAERFGVSMAEGLRSVRQTALWLLAPAVAGSLLLFVVAPWGLKALHWVDPRYLEVVRWLCPWIVLGVVNNVLGVQVLGAMGQGKPYARAFFIAALTTLALMLSLTPAWAERGIVIGMLAGEFALTMLTAMAVWSVTRARP
ncbi:oligosaccharide flippase family protein [Ralstonia pickettii]|uniref:oligosaccharide flippase family protein n=1 Tax=Ralstonia pickettii TaxID=329 RepID=UPI0015BCA237|nr:oligosaccharide flippase family protein [Ralstonia pickettii]NWK43823.1 oligosaccharide flippase family protein [Ralstonia pickettii]